jgi:hypothetical protein
MDWPKAAIGPTPAKKGDLQQAFTWFGKRKLREQIAAKDAEACGMSGRPVARSRHVGKGGILTTSMPTAGYRHHARRGLVLQRLAETAQPCIRPAPACKPN